MRHLGCMHNLVHKHAQIGHLYQKCTKTQQLGIPSKTDTLLIASQIWQHKNRSNKSAKPRVLVAVPTSR